MPAVKEGESSIDQSHAQLFILRKKLKVSFLIPCRLKNMKIKTQRIWR